MFPDFIVFPVFGLSTLLVSWWIADFYRTPEWNDYLKIWSILVLIDLILRNFIVGFHWWRSAIKEKAEHTFRLTFHSKFVCKVLLHFLLFLLNYLNLVFYQWIKCLSIISDGAFIILKLLLPLQCDIIFRPHSEKEETSLWDDR